MEVNVNKKQDRLVVDVTIDNDPVRKISATTAKIKLWLSENDYTYGECIQESRLCNRNNTFSGQWVFLLSNNKKTVDKTPQPVVSSNSDKKTKKNS
jgi:hypothetical protein